MADPRTLNFRSTDDVADEVRRLRAGYRRTGQWTLPQVCFHLDRIMASSMTPQPPVATTAEQAARRPVFDGILATGKIPGGLVAPDATQAPAETSDSAVDDFLNTLAAFKAYDGPFTPHRLFGNVTPAERRRHQLIHCGHHLAFLVPDRETQS